MTRILVIDDDDSVRLVLRTWLTREGYHVVLADSGEDGITIVQNSPVDAVIVDMVLPGMNGLETIRAIHDAAARPPVIAISGFAFSDALGDAPDFCDAAAKLGVTHF